MIPDTKLAEAYGFTVIQHMPYHYGLMHEEFNGKFNWYTSGKTTVEVRVSNMFYPKVSSFGTYVDFEQFLRDATEFREKQKVFDIGE